MVPNYEGYVLVFGEAFREIVRESIAAHRGNGNPFDQGYLCGLNRAVSLMQQTAEQFGIPADELGVAEFDDNAFF
jgi:hypothetical protein